MPDILSQLVRLESQMYKTMRYGLISDTDAYTIERTLDLICEEFKDDKVINILEIGCYGGDTGKGIKEYLATKNRQCFITGIDNNKDGEKLRFEYDCFLNGDSKDIYWTRADSFYHFIFQDADHSFLGVISDFFAYCQKVKTGGYFLFHDTGKHIKSFKDFQHGDKNNPDAYISTRKALKAIGALDNDLPEWRLVFDVEDVNDTAGGVVVLKKVQYDR